MGIEKGRVFKKLTIGLLLLLCCSGVRGDVLYVDLNNLAPIPPYNTWGRAATKIQDAIDEASDGDTVIVTNGVYDHLTLSMSRVTIDKAITVQSVNGPSRTVIEGGLNIRCAWLASNAVLAGFTLTNGNTRTSGGTVSDQSGGGAWCEEGGLLTNCLVTRCHAEYHGGGICRGTIRNCQIVGNDAGADGGGVFDADVFDSVVRDNTALDYGGGIYSGFRTAAYCVIENNYAGNDGGAVCEGYVQWCTVRGNRAVGSGGGLDECDAEHCMIYSNAAEEGGGTAGGEIRNCFITRNRAFAEGGGCNGVDLYNSTVIRNYALEAGGVYDGWVYNSIIIENASGGFYDNHDDCYLANCNTVPPNPNNIGTVTNAPHLYSYWNVHLATNSPCIDAGGTNMTWDISGLDMDGEARVNGTLVDIGCDEVHPAALTGTLVLAISVPATNIAAGYSVMYEAVVEGRAAGTRWYSGDGVVWSNVPSIEHVFSATGEYSMVLAGWNDDGYLAETVTLHVVAGFTNYVSRSGGHSGGFDSWATAATSIQAAVSANGVVGGVVLVTNGVYATGEYILHGEMRNRLVVTNPVTVRSVNGPASTVIEGQTELVVPPIRCAWLGSMSRLEGFTLTNGNTRTTGDIFLEQSGGGAYLADDAVLSNCVVTGCFADRQGGGVFGGSVYNCDLFGNDANHNGGGAFGAQVHGSRAMYNLASYGGGLAGGEAFECEVAFNEVTSSGGGFHGGWIWNSVLYGNVAGADGGGADEASLRSCHVYDNDAIFGGGVASSTTRGTTIVNNRATGGGGAADSLIDNSIVFYNHAAWESENTYNCNHRSSVIEGLTPDPPGLVGVNNPHLLAASVCIGAATNDTWMAGQLDIDGEDRICDGQADQGCDEYVANNITGVLSAAIWASATNAVAGTPVAFMSGVEGKATGMVWLIDGVPLYSNVCEVTHTQAVASDYAVVLQAGNLDESVAATVRVHVVAGYTNYVDALGGNNPPYESWGDAARRIQDAISACYAGGTVWVTNGTYTLGDTLYYSAVPTRVVLTNRVTVRSVNGPAVTTVRGIGPVGPTAVRCAYLAQNTQLDGFTLHEGHTLLSSDFYMNIRGGGAWCEANTLLTNCIISSCAAALNGGGVYNATLYNCELRENSASGNGGAADNSTLYDCIVTGNSCLVWGGGLYAGNIYGGHYCHNQARNGGAAYGCYVYDAVFSNNTGNKYGGALGSCYASNCLITHNWAGESGGGVHDTDVDDSTIFWNQADTNGVAGGGGAYGGLLRGCVLVGNSARYGGGAYSVEMQHSRILGNQAEAEGGGMAYGYAYNTAIISNQAAYGGGMYGGVLWNATVINNSAQDGGGIMGGSCYNGIVYYNQATRRGDNYADGRLQYSCSLPKPPGGCNLEGPPGLAGLTNPHLLSNSPCRNVALYADWMTNAVDLDGDAMGEAGQVDLGCDQFNSAGQVGVLLPTVTSRYTTVATGYALTLKGNSDNPVTGLSWQWDDGSTTANICVPSHAYSETGSYDVVLTVWNNEGLSAVTVTVTVVEQMVYHVAPGGLHQVPFTNWVMAATSIQSAVSAALVPGDCVLVSNGVYATGEVSVDGQAMNRVAVTNPVRVQSVDGPLVTVIQGAGPRGPTAVRCVYLGADAVLCGFTLSNGYTRVSGDEQTAQAGGGAWLETEGALTNCVVRNCSSWLDGGGVYGGLVLSSVLHDNLSGDDGGGAYGSTLFNCEVATNHADRLGGGVAYSAVFFCRLATNHAAVDGGGVAKADGYDSLILGNVADDDGGGAYDSSLRGCQVISNMAVDCGGGLYDGDADNTLVFANRCGDEGGGSYDANHRFSTIVGNDAEDHGGGVFDGILINAIVYYNTATNGGNNLAQYANLDTDYCCLGEPDGGIGNTTNPPMFRDRDAADFRLTTNSPCVDQGLDINMASDLRGVPRPLDGDDDGSAVPDMGAYEFISARADTDGDRFTDAEEEIACTDMVDADDYFHVTSLTATGQLYLSWLTVTGRMYTVSSTVDPVGQSWSNCVDFTDIQGVGDYLTYVIFAADTTACYRVSVER